MVTFVPSLTCSDASYTVYFYTPSYRTFNSRVQNTILPELGLEWIRQTVTERVVHRKSGTLKDGQ